jgi:hypothetical protein
MTTHLQKRQSGYTLYVPYDTAFCFLNSIVWNEMEWIWHKKNYITIIYKTENWLESILNSLKKFNLQFKTEKLTEIIYKQPLLYRVKMTKKYQVFLVSHFTVTLFLKWALPWSLLSWHALLSTSLHAGQNIN